MIELEATQLNDGWAVRPKNQLGTCGFSPVPWTVIYIKAPTAEQAITKARKLLAYTAMYAGHSALPHSTSNPK